MLFPTRDGEPPLVGIHTVLPIGWCESPSSFYVATETTYDEAKDNIENRARWESTKISHRMDVVSIKKLLKGDSRWDTRKIILGLLIDNIQGTIELPPRRTASRGSMHCWIP